MVTGLLLVFLFFTNLYKLFLLRLRSNSVLIPRDLIFKEHLRVKKYISDWFQINNLDPSVVF